MSRGTIAALLLAATTLGGCAAVSGAPKPVRTLPAVTLPADIQRFVDQYDAAGTTEDGKKVVRNRMISRYLAAADDRYDAFVADLTKQLHGTNVAADVGVLALTGIGSVAKGAANELAAAAAFLTGSRASVNKELYFELALPAIITSMDANRQRVEIRIAGGRRLSVAEYSIDDALSDLRDYERAGNINRAFNQLNEAAKAAFDKEEREYPCAVEACVPTAELAPIRRAIINHIGGLIGKARAAMPDSGTPEFASLGRIATALKSRGLKPDTQASSAADLVAQQDAVRELLLSSCSINEAEQLKTDILGGSNG